MNKIFLIILFLGITTICEGQSTQIKYYAKYLREEVAEENAKFSETITQNSDGTVTTEVKKLKSNKVLSSSTYKGEEPFGIWIYQTMGGTSTLDYNFPLVYSDQKCSDFPIKNYFQNNDTLGYKAPKIATEEKSIGHYFARNLIYPVKARENGIQGKVYLMLTITKEGNVESVVVTKGANIYLDKEAVRLLRKLKFSAPATINGQPLAICVSLPISFQLA